MNPAEVSARYLWMPAQPLWLAAKCIARYDSFQAEYYALAQRNLQDVDVLITQPNITLQQVNDYASDPSRGYGVFAGPWITPESDTYSRWVYTNWEIDAPGPTPSQEFIYWSAMCTGLMTWQMYTVLLSEQFVRFFQFGHYGRKPKEES